MTHNIMTMSNISSRKLLVAGCLVALAALIISQAEAANRVNLHQVSRQTNQCKYLFSELHYFN